MSNKAEVIKRVCDGLAPVLREKQFLRFSGVHAYRDRPEAIDVLWLEFFDRATLSEFGVSQHSFGISFGKFLKFAPTFASPESRRDALGNLEPDGAMCAIRSYLRRLPTESARDQGVAGALDRLASRILRVKPKQTKNPVVWGVEEDLSNVEAILAELKTRLVGEVLPWFSHFESIDQILQLFTEGDIDFYGAVPCFGFGKVNSPLRNLLLGFTAHEAGKNRLARESLARFLDAGGAAGLSGAAEAIDTRAKELLSTLGE